MPQLNLLVDTNVQAPLFAVLRSPFTATEKRRRFDSNCFISFETYKFVINFSENFCRTAVKRRYNGTRICLTTFAFKLLSGWSQLEDDLPHVVLPPSCQGMSLSKAGYQHSVSCIYCIFIMQDGRISRQLTIAEDWNKCSSERPVLKSLDRIIRLIVTV